MYSQIEAKFAAAVAKNKLFFTPAVQKKHTLENGVEYIVSSVESLAHKPSSTAGSPWLPPDEDLLVKSEGDYNVVLNKYAIAKYHLLLVTKEQRPQRLPLTEEDWEAAFNLLKQLNKESGKRYLGFYNSGPASGASIDHKHVQFVPVPDGFRPFPDSAGHKPDDTVANDGVPFAHYIVGLPQNASAETVTLRYSEALGRVLTKISLANEGVQRPEISYNLVFTEEWILATPRKAAETKDHLAVNSLGTVGMFLAKNEAQTAELEKDAFKVFEDIGFPYEKIEHYAPDFKGYTHY